MIRQRVEQLFGLPAMKMPWSLYLGQLNEAGKLTARSIMDILTIVLTSIEEMEKEIPNSKPEPTKQYKLPKDLSEDIHKVTEEVIAKGLPDAILGNKPPKVTTPI